MRRLIYIPIIHGEIDMGSLADRLKEEYIAKSGEDKWREYLNVADELWNEIGGRLERLNLDYKKVKLFQDGLPKSGKEIDIVRELALKGSANYKLLLNLIEKGAELIGTEDPQLLIREYNHVQDIVKPVPEGLPSNGSIGGSNRGEAAVEDGSDRLEKYREIGALLLSERDGYIAGRINESLKQGETGILFIGIAHKVDKRLPEDIKIEYLS